MKNIHDITITTANNERSKLMPTSSLSNRGLLLILSENFIGKTFVIDQIYTIIGRLDKCRVKIDDPLVSKEHCAIIFDKDNKFYIEDLGSKNFTYLNGKPLKKRTHVIYGDRIIIGDTIMRFYLEEKLERKGK